MWRSIKNKLQKFIRWGLKDVSNKAGYLWLLSTQPKLNNFVSSLAVGWTKEKYVLKVFRNLVVGCTLTDSKNIRWPMTWWELCPVAPTEHFSLNYGFGHLIGVRPCCPVKGVGSYQGAWSRQVKLEGRPLLSALNPSGWLYVIWIVSS